MACRGESITVIADDSGPRHSAGVPTIVLAVALWFAAAPLWAAESAAAHPAPNILLIIADDQGFGDFGFTGNRLVRTPHIDRLAGQSAVYRNFVVAAACSPTRSALFTGRDHLLTGVWGVGERAGLRDDETRMPAFFKAAGYRTLHVGKLDCAKVGRQSPLDFGWDDYLGGGGYEHRDPMLWKPRNSARGSGWTADLWTDYTVKFVTEQRDRPWFISLAYIIPHMPWECAETYSQPFIEAGCSKNLAACYGAIAHLDESMGRLLAALEDTRQAERTIVVFLSDNGPTSPEVKTKTEDALEADPDWVQRNVARLRGHKALDWENGIRNPLLVRWPGKIAPGDRRQFGGVEDVLPTLLDLAAIKPDALPHLPFSGVSLRPSLDDPAREVEHPPMFRIAIAGPGAPRDKIADAAARKFEDHHLTLRTARWKYHALPGGRQSLYDLQNDPGERTDVAAQQPEIVQSMARQCRQRWEEVINSGRAFAVVPDARKPKDE